jgi:hypothetical protein
MFIPGSGVVRIIIRKISGTPRPLKTIAQHPFETPEPITQWRYVVSLKKGILNHSAV